MENMLTHRRTLSEFVRSHHLHIQVFALRLAPGLDQPLQHLRQKKDQTGRSGLKLALKSATYLWRGNLNVNNDRSKGGFGELCWVVDGVGIQNHQLQSFGELKYPLNLTLDFSCSEKKQHFDACSLSLIRSNLCRFGAHIKAVT